MGPESSEEYYQGLVLFGATGNVGTRFIEKVTEEDYPEDMAFANEALEHNPYPHQHPSKFIAIANSSHYLVDLDGIDAKALRETAGNTRESVKKLLEEKGIPYNNPAEVVDAVREHLLAVLKEQRPRMKEEHVVYIDSTDGKGLRLVYDEVLLQTQSGMVAVNKGVLSELNKSEFDAYTAQGHLEFKPTVGAGANAVDECMMAAETEHPITEIVATLSGTCGELSNRLNSEAYLNGKLEFSDIVRDLHRDGHTEPHPHTDLSGEDVKKKITILGLASGYDVSMKDIVVESPIVPDQYGERFPAKDNVDGYLGAMKELDADMRLQVEDAHKEGKKLLYLASMKVEAGKPILTVGFEAVDPSHRIANAKDNMIILKDGIEIQAMEKPGSGRDVTARSMQKAVAAFVPKGQARKR